MASRRLAGIFLLLYAATMGASAAAIEHHGEQVYLVPQEQLTDLSRYLNETLFPASNENIQRFRSTSQQTFFDLEDQFLLHRGSYLAIDASGDAATRNQSRVTFRGDQGVSQFEGKSGGRAYTAGDKHALLSRVKRIDRARFTEILGGNGVGNLFALMPVVRTDTEQVVYLFAAAGTEHLTVKLNRINSRILGRDKPFVTLSILPQSEQGRVVAGGINAELERFSRHCAAATVTSIN